MTHKSEKTYSGCGIRVVEEESLPLVLRERQAIRDGQPGKHAPQTIPGLPAGSMIIQISQSDRSQGAIQVQRRENRSVHLLPEITEVPVGRNIKLTAIGGKGENGPNGGNG